MDAPRPRLDTFASIVRSAVDHPEISSAVVFVTAPGTTDLVLAAAADVDGPPLERLVAAVRDPAHPIVRTLVEGIPAFDVTPMAPGGPALRSHLPLIVERDGAPVATGVLAVAHDRALDAASRSHLVDLAARAAGVAGDGDGDHGPGAGASTTDPV
jgi:hypothetical protein